jgi:hypothetical protein
MTGIALRQQGATTKERIGPIQEVFSDWVEGDQ